MNNFQIKGAPTCRVAYQHGLFEKTVTKGTAGKPRYNCNILIPKDDVEKVEQVKAFYAEAFKELQAKGFKGKTAKAINPKNNALLDGDELADEKEGKEAFRGYLVLKVASENFRPIVTDMKQRSILNCVPISGLPVEKISDEMLGSGDYVLCNVSFWTYCNSTAEGIGANVHAVMRMGKGEEISGVSQDVNSYIDTSGITPPPSDDLSF